MTPSQNKAYSKSRREKGVTNQEEHLLLKQLKKLKVEATIEQLIMTSQKYRQLLIDELNEIELSP